MFKNLSNLLSLGNEYETLYNFNGKKNPIVPNRRYELQYLLISVRRLILQDILQ